jgi:RNA-directed DNA polymerase
MRKEQPMEQQPTPVLATTIQVGETPTRWSWVEPAVWTERMLTTLEQGVKGGKWFSLIDKVYSAANLASAFTKVAANDGASGVDHVGVKDFERNLEVNLAKLHEQLRDGTYHPQAVRRVWIPKPGSAEKRPLGIPTVRDRTVQAATRHIIEPIFERDFAEHSYGFRPGRGCKDALRRVDDLLKQGYRYVVDADLKAYFDSIPHDKLMNRLREKISDSRVLSLIESFLQAKILDEAKDWSPEAGSPQGAVLSPLLSNVYLNPLDHLMVSEGFEMVRYADDFVILCRTEEAAHRALEIVRAWVNEAGLKLHPEKTRIVNVDAGSFEFLGYEFRKHYRFPRKKSLTKLKASLRPRLKRTSGFSLKTIIADVNLTLRGWFEYFKHAWPTAFPAIDSWVRMRLRSILRKRAGRRGRGRGLDHHRYPNQYFEEQGLFCLEQAHAALCQSSSR